MLPIEAYFLKGDRWIVLIKSCCRPLLNSAYHLPCWAVTRPHMNSILYMKNSFSLLAAALNFNSSHNNVRCYNC